MQYDAQNAKVPALSRTWETVTLDRMDGAVVQVRQHTVTISKHSGVLMAEVDGQPADMLTADRILRGADERHLKHEIKPFPASMARCLGVSA
ncbi:hypothetical protein [Deinococcus sp.]|uniref:hypothetical protein n=1 Tax=Deinococcus sp. TaxID=47478 RepID=UPI00391A4341